MRSAAKRSRIKVTLGKPDDTHKFREKVEKDLPDNISEIKNAPVLDWCMHEAMRFYGILFNPRLVFSRQKN
jgi:hypothetical protein